jgi:hypothetical protein
MRTISPEEYKKLYGETSYNRLAGNLSQTQENKPNLLSRVGTDLSKRISDVQQSFKKEVTPQGTPLGGIRLGLRTVGAVAGGITDVATEGIKSLSNATGLTEAVKPIGLAILDTDVGKAGLNAIKSGAEAYSTFAKSNPDTAKALGDVLNITSLLPIGAGAKIAGQGAVDLTKGTIKGIESGISGTTRVTSKLIESIKPKIKPVPTPLQATGQILQGKTKDLNAGVKALASIKTKGIKTFKELDDAFSKKVEELSRVVDSSFEQDTTKTLLKDISTSGKTVSGTVVKSNPVENALIQLSELYTKTGDVVKKTNIDEIINMAKTQGLTKGEINDIAKAYGSEFGSKAFGKTGEALTSVNAQMFENTRKAVKEVARSGISGAEAKLADQTMSSILNTQKLVKNNIEAVNKLKQRIQEMGLLAKFGNDITKYADILTGGSVRGFIGGLLPRGAGYKVMNALDLEEILAKNLDIINQAIKSGKASDIQKILNPKK